MALTRLQLVTEALNNLGRRTSTLSPDGSTTLGDRAVSLLNNVVLRRVARGVDGGTGGLTPTGYFFSELNKTSQASTVISQARYGLPSTLREIYSIRLLDDSESRKLTQLGQRLNDRFYPNTDNWPATGHPYYYLRYGFQLELVPIPDAAYTLELRWAAWPTALSTDGSTSDLREKDDLLIAGLTAELFSAYQEHEADAATWHTKFQLLLREAIAADPHDWDWNPSSLPHTTEPPLVGDYWKDPFIGNNP